MERTNPRKKYFVYSGVAAFLLVCGFAPACNLVNGIDHFSTDPSLDISPKAACVTESDCPGTDTECGHRTCTGNACGTDFTAKGTAVLEQVIGDCHANQCDGAGNRVDGIVDTTDVADDGKECTADTCSATGEPLHDPAMAGTSCAMGTMVCDGKGACVECASDNDCVSKGTGLACYMNHCVPKECNDQLQNGQESDVDCGGMICAPCATGFKCTAGTDCASKTCTMGKCAEPACDDMQFNGQETDVDCGGNCMPCVDGLNCLIGADCTSKVCATNVCQAPACNDGLQNGDETHTDCGGSCGGCPEGSTCATNAECNSEFCLSGICAKIVQVVAGTMHACAVVQAAAGQGKVYCWGGNNNGELGYGGMGTNQLQPVQQVNNLENVTSISTFSNTTMTPPYGSHTCARTELNGTVTFLCWGNNQNGQLGNGTQTSSVQPVNIAFAAGSVVNQVVAGGRHTCAIMSTGHVQCWGANGQGQCGVNGTNFVTKPQAVGGTNPLGAMQLSLGTIFTCARLMTGEVSCWGSNGYGQLGYGGVSTQSTPKKLTSITGVSQLAAGQDFICGFTGTKTFCWGDDSDKQFGEGVQQAGTTPLEVLNVLAIQPLPLTMGAAGITGIPDTNGGHTCFIEAGGKLVCLGLNDHGQVGVMASTTPINKPTEVMIEPVRQVALGTQFTCAVLEKGPIRCWGRNELGQLGAGNSMESNDPVSVKWPGP